jgi:hypothetical protein
LNTATTNKTPESDDNGIERGFKLLVFGPKRDEATGEWRRPHNEELNDPYSSPNIIRIIKSRRMRWAGM